MTPGHTALQENAHSKQCLPRPPGEVLEAGRLAAQAFAQSAGIAERRSLANSFCLRALSFYWQAVQSGFVDRWALPRVLTPFETGTLPAAAKRLAERIGFAAAELEPADAAYRVGLIYTAMLPADLRSRFGVYYTPPALAERLLDMASEAGIDWAICKALDPACGGGAFLTPVAQRMVGALPGHEPGTAVQDVGRRLRGFEIDPFAAWASQLFLEAALMPLCRRAGRRLPQVVKVCDSLDQEALDGRFDLVVGNPPYGKVRLSPERRERYRRSLYGHANLYGLFTDLALRLTRPGGVIAYVTPTSFLAGEYFKALRAVLGQEAPPAGIDFLALRKGIFDDVLQETLLATYRRGGAP